MGDVERALAALREAAQSASSITLTLDERYLDMIRQVEALRDNQPGADKTARARMLAWTATPVVEGPFDPHR
jgi:hypothetical protein